MLQGTLSLSQKIVAHTGKGVRKKVGAIYIADAKAIETRIRELVNKNPQNFDTMPALPRRMADFPDQSPQSASSPKLSLGRGNTSEGVVEGRRKSGAEAEDNAHKIQTQPSVSGGRKKAVQLAEITSPQVIATSPPVPTAPPIDHRLWS